MRSLATNALFLSALLALVGCTEEMGTPDNAGADGDNAGPRPPTGGDDDAPPGVRPVESTSTLTRSEQKDGYKTLRYEFLHPAVHGKSAKRDVAQMVDVVIPNGVEKTDPVFFLVAGAENATVEQLLERTSLPRFFRSRMIYVIAEHRGYGESLSMDENQSVPAYVSERQAIEDAHVVIDALRGEYTGPWIAFGDGYAGALVAELGAKYPEDAKAFVASSAPIRWPSLNETHEGYVRRSIGDVAFDKAKAHMMALEPSRPFRTKWRDREILEGAWRALAERRWAVNEATLLQALVSKTTEELVDGARAIDEANPAGGAVAWGESRATETVTREELLAADHSARVWYYQQCTGVGGLFVSPTGDGLFRRDAEGHMADCAALFADSDVLDLKPGSVVWDVEDALPAYYGEGAPKLLYVRGGKDAFQDMGLRAPNWDPRVSHAKYRVYDTKFGSFLDVPAGTASPDRGDIDVVFALWAEMTRLAGLTLEAR